MRTRSARMAFARFSPMPGSRRKSAANAVLSTTGSSADAARRGADGVSLGIELDVAGVVAVDTGGSGGFVLAAGAADEAGPAPAPRSPPPVTPPMTRGPQTPPVAPAS